VLKNKIRKNYSKIILFGEYSVLHGANFLAIPCKKYFCYPTFKNSNQLQRKILKDLSHYLKETLGSLKIDFDFSRFMSEINSGLVFLSNIPQGLGHGSSGALCAGLYYRYCKNPEDLDVLKDNLSKMESFYHGKSSGVDPLVSYLNCPILQNSKGELIQLNSQDVRHFSKYFYTLNSGVVRDDINFSQVYENAVRGNSMTYTVLGPEIVNRCIDSFLKEDITQLTKSVKELSLFQYQNFKCMIPKELLSLWETGLSTDLFYLKLCGAGGGGNFLVYSEDICRAKKLLAKFQVSSLDGKENFNE
jgi:mevalonate kinase